MQSVGNRARSIMKSDYFLLIVFSVSLSVSTLTQPCAHAQDQGSSDASSQSWTATTQQRLPSNDNPTRTSETHTDSGGRTIDNQHTENMGMDGHYEPYLDVQKESVKVDANTTRTVERTFGRDSDGRKILVQVTEEESRICREAK